MEPDRRRASVLRVRFILAILALTILTVGLRSARVIAQAADQRVKELEVQVRVLQDARLRMDLEHARIFDSLHDLMAIKIEQRLIKLEAITESTGKLLWAIAVAMALQLLETIFRILSGRPRKED